MRGCFFYGPGELDGSRRSVLMIEKPGYGMSDRGVELKVPLMMSVHTGSVKKASEVQCWRFLETMFEWGLVCDS